jgi:DNA-binding XRE family transcriptional regulator
MATTWQEARDRRLESMSDEQRAEYELDLARARWAGDIAPMVYDARTQAGLSQVELGRRAGIPQTRISAIENSRVTPTLETLRRIGEALGAPVRLGLGEEMVSAGS